jgi:hypothetical protein
MSERSFDDVARALAQPMRRRRALRLAGAALVGAALPGLRPRAARAAGYPCTGLNSQKCSSGGAQVCVPPDWECCSNDLCAGACEPWESCSAGNGCDDTPDLCTNPKAAGVRGGGGSGGMTKFCSKRLSGGPTICYPQGRTLTWGWCCREGETCGKDINDCECNGTECGGRCCEHGKVCADELHSVCCPNHWNQCTAGGAGVVKCCPPKDTCCFNHRKHTAVCCDAGHPCVDGRCTCKKHEERCGGNCCSKGQSCVNGVCLHD